MSYVIVFYKDRYPEKHIFNDFSDALEFATLAFDEQYVQSITINYERTSET